jgi:hypothetical protein
MGFVGGKTPTEPKLYSYFSNLRHIEHDKVGIMYFVHSHNMGDKISLRTSSRKVGLLNQWKDCPTLHNVSNFT